MNFFILILMIQDWLLRLLFYILIVVILPWSFWFNLASFDIYLVLLEVLSRLYSRVSVYSFHVSRFPLSMIFWSTGMGTVLRQLVSLVLALKSSLRIQ